MHYDHVLDKRMLRRSFEQAAAGYDQSAVLQREICDRMLSRLEYINIFPPEYSMRAAEPVMARAS